MGEGLGKGGVSGRAGAEAKAMAPSLRFSQLFPWPAAERTQGGRVRGGGKEEAGKHSEQTLGKSFNGEKES